MIQNNSLFTLVFTVIQSKHMSKHMFNSLSLLVTAAPLFQSLEKYMSICE